VPQSTPFDIALYETYLFVFALAAFAAFAAWLAALAAALAAFAIVFAVVPDMFEVEVFDVVVFIVDVFVVVVFILVVVLVRTLAFVLLAVSPQAIPSALTAKTAERAITFFMIELILLSSSKIN
jgi:hypothetical protein